MDEIKHVRMLMSDIDATYDPRDLSKPPEHIFTDEQIQLYLDIESGNVKRAAASALTAIAINEALITKVIKTDDKQTDGSKLMTSLLKAAESLRKQAIEDEENMVGFKLVGFEPVPTDWAWR